MTATQTEPAQESVGRPKFHARRFWWSILTGVFLIVATLIFVAVESPTPSDERFLSPNSQADVGASILAEELTAQGVDIQRYDTAAEGLRAASGGDVTVFVPAPEFFNSDDRSLFEDLTSSDVDIVLVQPPQWILNRFGLNLGDSRIATATVTDTDCPALPVSGAVQLGRQAYEVSEYSPWEVGDRQLCFDAYLAVTAFDLSTAVVTGSGDPFGNAMIGEVDNLRFALDVLGQHDTLIWLDVHERAAIPQSPPVLPDYSDPPSRSPVEIPYPESTNTNPIYDVMPAWIWAGLVGILLLVVLAALWRGRRLGPPAAEPLPVSVPAAETVHGRAMLYRRARAYPQALRALRSGALHRLRPIVGLSTQSPESDIVAAVAARSGWPVEQVSGILFHTEVENERQLMDLSNALDRLVDAVENAEPQGRTE